MAKSIEIKGVKYEIQLKNTPILTFNSVAEWETDAKKRTDEYHNLVRQKQPVPAVAWILVTDNTIPANAIQLGNEKNGLPLYAARAYFENGLHVGKTSLLIKGAEIPWGTKANIVPNYEILVGSPSAVEWVSSLGKLAVSNGQYQGHDLIGGGTDDGKSLYIARTHYEHGIHIGKVGSHTDGCYLSFGEKEKYIPDYQVLVYSNEL
ncbi:hypothetical protein BC833DRAFT_607923 [Globomyces pollinis-pini]|nr:hypothetical protein BC833DRAFT_607923 [Globomyces pollinis-pini]